MSQDRTLEALVERGILTSARHSEVELAPAFLDAVERYESRVRGSDWESRFAAEATLTEGEIATMLEALGQDPRAMALFWAVDESDGDVPIEEKVRITLTLDVLQRPPEREDGIPDGFVGLRGDQLRTYLPLLGRALVYVWREDCEPCDTLVSQFDRIRETVLSEYVCIAVYGPNAQSLLSAKFDVGVAPTTLFVVDGSIESRLLGAHPHTVIETEIRTTESSRTG